MIGVGVLLFITGDVISGIWLGFIGLFLSQAARSAEVQAAFAGRIEGLRVEDVMDAEPVAIPETCRSTGPRTSTSCATAGPGSRSWTPPGGWWAWCRARRWTAWPSGARPRPVASVMARDDGGERAARRPRRAARGPAHPRGPGPPGRGDGRGRRRRPARDRDHRPGPAGAAGAAVEQSPQLRPRLQFAHRPHVGHSHARADRRPRARAVAGADRARRPARVRVRGDGRRSPRPRCSAPEEVGPRSPRRGRLPRVGGSRAARRARGSAPPLGASARAPAAWRRDRRQQPAARRPGIGRGP